MVSGKLLLTSVCAFGLVCSLSLTANAQCVYRMNDVGRPHGYLSGPCNGAALNYAGAYSSKQRAAPSQNRYKVLSRSPRGLNKEHKL
jgi:hypothetical protein